MNFTVKKHSKEEFYPIYQKWLESQNFPNISDLVLPENCFVCYVGEIPVYCVWFYHTDSRMAQVGWPASNKNVNFKTKQGGLKYLFEEVTKYAKRKGYLRLFTTSATDSVIDALNGVDYVQGEQCHHYYKIIK